MINLGLYQALQELARAPDGEPVFITLAIRPPGTQHAHTHTHTTTQLGSPTQE